MDEADVGNEFVAAVGRRDWHGIGACFSEEALLRVLTPHQVREAAGRSAIVARYRAWLERLEGFQVVAASADVVADRVRVVYRFRGRDPEHGPQLNEHTGYGEVVGGAFAFLNVSCAGFRPDASAGARS